MAKVIYCKESVTDALKAEFTAVNYPASSGMMGIKIITVKDELMKGFKTKEDKPADAIIVDESAFKMQIPTFDSIIKEQADDIVRGKTTLYSYSSQLINRLCNKKGDDDGRKDTGDKTS